MNQGRRKHRAVMATLEQIHVGMMAMQLQIAVLTKSAVRQAVTEEKPAEPKRRFYQTALEAAQEAFDGTYAGAERVAAMGGKVRRFAWETGPLLTQDGRSMRYPNGAIYPLSDISKDANDWVLL